jgi:hypothetical protein
MSCGARAPRENHAILPTRRHIAGSKAQTMPLFSPRSTPLIEEP